MQYFDWNKQCPYAMFYNYGYPTDYGHNNYSMPWSDDLEGLSRAQRDIERVLPLIFQGSANEINQAIALGMNPRLIAYLIREMVSYIDRNYDQYDKSASYNITAAAEGIKTELYWILNIFRIFGVPFDVQIRLLNNAVITSMRNLRVPASNTTTTGMR